MCMTEKRRWIRTKPQGQVPRTGKIFLVENAELVDCRIVDLSAGGACVELSKLYDLPKRIEFIYGRTRMICRVVWVRGYRVGFMYEATKEKSTIAGGLSRKTAGMSRLSRLGANS